MLSPLIPGCSVAGDQILPGSRFVAPMPRRCPECKLAVPRQRPSVPRLRRPILAADGCEPSLSRPGVLLLRRLGPSGPRGVTVAMFGRAGLGMLIRR